MKRTKRLLSILLTLTLILASLALPVWAAEQPDGEEGSNSGEQSGETDEGQQPGGIGSMAQPTRLPRSTTYTVTYDAGGGKGGYTSNPVAEGDTHTVLTLSATGITKPFYDFQSWNTERDGSDVSYAPGDQITVNDNFTLYAIWQWDGTTVNVIYDPNGGTGGSTKNVQPYTDHTVLDNETASVSWPGYSMTSWNTEADGSGLSYTPGGTLRVEDEDITLYAWWEANPYTVTFETNGGSAIDSQTVTFEQLVTRPEDPIRRGYIFRGWYADAAFTTVWNFNTDTMPANNLTLYARWTFDATAEFYITYDPNGGAGGARVTENHGSTHVVLDADSAGVARDGYALLRWNTEPDGSGQEYNFSNTFPVTDDRTLYSQWEGHKLDMTAGSGGTVVRPAFWTYKAGEDVPVKAVPDPGYVFDGWSDDVGGSFADPDKVKTAYTMPNSAATVTANFVAYNPTLSLRLADGVATVGTVYNRPILHDYNGIHSLTFTATGLPPGLSVSGSSITGTPTRSGVYTVTVTVEEDGTSLSDTGSFALTVSNPGSGRGSGGSGSIGGSSRSSDASSPLRSGASAGKTSASASHLGGCSWSVDLPLLGFLSATVDGDTSTRGEDYTVRSGSTILTLSDSYVASLRSGPHTLRMEFLSATATIDFTVTPTGTGGGDVGEPNAPALTSSGNDTMNPSTGGVEAAGSIAVLLAVVGLWAIVPKKIGR